MKTLFLRLLVALFLPTAPLSAHLTPDSEIRLEIGRDRIDATLVIPLGELQYAEPSFRDISHGAVSAGQKSRIADYLHSHIGAHAPDGRAWKVRIGDIRVTDDPADLSAALTLYPPQGAPVRRLFLRYDAVIDRSPNHIALLWMKIDFEAGYLADRPALLAGLRQGNTSVMIDRGPGSAWRGFGAAIGMGVHHIAEGHDHLLFLIALLLPAPLLASGGRWVGYAGWRKTIRSLAMIVTAFTIGHSLTLIGGAVLDWELPSQPVEILIAASILISAIHAWRPIFPGREPLIASGFGLVHGLAFATIVGRIGLDPSQKAQSILGFNLGIELIQLVVVAAVAPILLLLAQSSQYARIKSTAAALAGSAALLWIAERASGRELAAARMMDDALGYAPGLFALVILAAAVGALRRRLKSA